jgi:hypothetical protein
MNRDTNLPALYEQRFSGLENKLDAMHEDFRDLKRKVLNGISERMSSAETDVALLKAARESAEKSHSRWQTAFLTLMVALSTSLILYAVKHFNTHP